MILQRTPDVVGSLHGLHVVGVLAREFTRKPPLSQVAKRDGGGRLGAYFASCERFGGLRDGGERLPFGCRSGAL